MKALYTLSLALLIGSASAYEIVFDGDITDVGDLDTFIDSGYLATSNDPDSEIAEFADLGLSLSFDGAKSEDVQAYEVIGEDMMAFQLSSGPGYYIVKNAHGDPNVLLFENLSSFDWGVIDADYLSMIGVGDELQISHVTELNSSVPEPATLGLLALGIFGLGAARRRKAA